MFLPSSGNNSCGRLNPFLTIPTSNHPLTCSLLIEGQIGGVGKEAFVYVLRNLESMSPLTIGMNSTLFSLENSGEGKNLNE